MKLSTENTPLALFRIFDEPFISNCSNYYFKKIRDIKINLVVHQNKQLPLMLF